MQNWMNDVTEDMLPEAHRKLAEVIGVGPMLKLCETYGGMALYIPITDTIYPTVRAEMIRREYNEGENIPRLARRYDLTIRSVQRIVEDLPPQQIDGQMNLFEHTI